MKMKKLNCPRGFVLEGTNNEGYRYRYSVEKNENFKKIFIEFMKDLGFDEEKIKKTFIGCDEERDGVHIELRISEFEDCCRNYDNDKYNIDVFYGHKKIILVIRSKERRQILDNLEYKSKWKKFPKAIKIKEKAKMPLMKLRTK